MSSIRLERLSFSFQDAAPIVDGADVLLGPGWTGLVGANGAGKTTLLRLVAGDLLPDAGRVAMDPEDARVVLCPQEVAEPGAPVAALRRRHAKGDREARRLAGALGLEPAELARWGTLSPGERKRWQIAAALASEPDVLLLDEPTNHVDADARALLREALLAFRGAGVLVSHDRALLDALTVRTLRLDRGAARLVDGAYGQARETWEAESRAAWSRRAEAQADVRKASRKLAEARRRRDAAERSQSGAHRDPKDSDARTLGAKTLRSWAEARLARDVRTRRAVAERAAEDVQDAPPPAAEVGRSVFLGWARAPRSLLLGVDADEVRAGSRVVLRDVHAWLGRDDRVRLAGPNGSGKTTLLRALLAAAPLAADRVLFLPQELPPGAGTALLDEVRSLAPEVRGRVLSLVAALGTDPARLLGSSSPSPGEARKLVLALGLGRHAWALVLDEPTNHLDLPTVERLGVALAAYPGALLVVAHDDAFAAEVTRATWRIEGGRLDR
jgi:ATPase subunit of ABC transporter with duplicated ATPase domains